MKNKGCAPCAKTSLAHIATKSIPTLKYDLVLIANFNLVPTPSVLETSIGSLKQYFFKSNKPPNPPNSPIEPLLAVVSVILAISVTSLLP